MLKLIQFKSMHENIVHIMRLDQIRCNSLYIVALILYALKSVANFIETLIYLV